MRYGSDHKACFGKRQRSVVMAFERAAGAVRHHDQRQIAPRDCPAIRNGLHEQSEPLWYGWGFARIPNSDFERLAGRIRYHDLLESGRKSRHCAQHHYYECSDRKLH
jgi:hypothetical protein